MRLRSELVWTAVRDATIVPVSLVPCLCAALLGIAISPCMPPCAARAARAARATRAARAARAALMAPIFTLRAWALARLFSHAIVAA